MMTHTAAVIAVLTAAVCFAPAPPVAALEPVEASAPEDKEPPPDTPQEEGQHFCCTKVEIDSLSGDDCVPVGPGQVVLCNEVLYCAGSWAKSEGKTKCVND